MSKIFLLLLNSILLIYLFFLLFSNIKEIYSLQTGWALKENQKFGKKGAEKRMTNQVRALLEGYFIAGNADKSNHYTA